MAVTKEQVAELYVAYFNRAPDTKGLDYWIETGSAIEDISSSFYEQDETKTNYPDSMSDAIFVNTIYKNVFNRDSEPNGLTYWENELANGTITRPNMILAITKGAKDTDTTKDATILANKTEVGLYSANAGVNDVDKATDVMKDVDETSGSVTEAKAIADNYSVLILTTKQDTLVGTTKDDIINGLIASSGSGSTYTAGDTIDGGDGNDTFKLQVTGRVADVSAKIENVETVEIFGGSPSVGISTFNWTGVKNYKFTDQNRSISNIKESIESLTIDKAKSNMSATLNFLNKDIVDTDNDTLDITLSNSSSPVTVKTEVNGRDSDLYEELKIHSIDNTKGASLTISDAGDVKKVTISGNSDMNITLTGADSNEMLDASALTGKLIYNSSADSDETIKGGSGDDDINASTSKSTIWGGAGDDKIYAGSIGSTIHGGQGKDTIDLSDGIDNIKYDNLVNESGLTTKTSDILKDFNSTMDKISFRGLEGGTKDNFYQTSTNTNVTSVETAVIEANKGVLHNKMYVEYNTTNENISYLVIDSNGDAKADSVIDLNATSITFDSIGIY